MVMIDGYGRWLQWYLIHKMPFQLKTRFTVNNGSDLSNIRTNFRVQTNIRNRYNLSEVWNEKPQEISKWVIDPFKFDAIPKSATNTMANDFNAWYVIKMLAYEPSTDTKTISHHFDGQLAPVPEQEKIPQVFRHMT